ncbi:MAG: hypothetical protein IPP01_10895 [Saprospiraceae bacterium]|nr:hypothetical protein [Saprospiraceae bacterium]
MFKTRQSIADLAFWGIVSINLLYLNGLFTSIFNIETFFSPLILICCIIVLFTTPKPKNYTKLLLVLLLFFSTYFYIGGIIAILNPQNIHAKTSIYTLYRGYFSSILIYFSIYQYLINEYNKRGKERLLNILHNLIFFLLVPLFFTIFGKQLGLSDAMTYLKDYGDRQTGIFTNPNTAGLQANYVLCFSLYSILARRRWRLFWIMLVPISFYAVFLCLSKAGLLMAIINLILFVIFNFVYFFRFELVSKLNAALIITLFIASGFIIYNNFEGLVSTMTPAQASRVVDAIRISQGEINDQTTSERSGIAELVFPRIKEHLLFGNGIGSFHRIVDHGLGVHNSGLMIIGEAGVVPLMFFLGFVFLYIKCLLKLHNFAIKFLFLSIFSTFILVSFLTSHNALDERISNVLLAIFIVLVNKVE